ncbi:hypothetical protein, partial [Klebsiella pneumoniae]|uniref:hypothetical protein n=1 Tax=Klebsiella pneumoniae TaxID=573 RepID=UPI0019535835
QGPCYGNRRAGSLLAHILDRLQHRKFTFGQKLAPIQNQCDRNLIRKFQLSEPRRMLNDG